MHHYVQLHQTLAELVQQSARLIVPKVMSWLNPASVVDVGCGNGSWLAEFQRAGVTDILGVDGDYIRPEELEIPATTFLAHDLTQPLPLSRTFDLAVCTEVAEHLPESVALNLIRQLTELAPVVLFSAAIPGQGGVNHINEQWQSYWSEAFAHHGYNCWDVIRPMIWEAESIGYWYAQNLFLFCRADASDRLPESLRSNNRSMPLNVVHPRRFAAACRDMHYLEYPSITCAAGQLACSLGRRLGFVPKKAN